MDQDGTSLPPAPEFPQAPEPLPLPTPVTGVGRMGGGDGNRKTIIGVVVAVAVVVALLSAVGLPVYVFMSAGTVVPSAASEGLRRLAAKQYPDFTAGKVTSRGGRTSATDETRLAMVWVALQHTAHPGFVYYATYTAPATAAADVNAYDNLDDFFREWGVAQPVDSFIVMWLRDHPGEQCDFVFETGEPTDEPRRYEVGYMRSERDNGVVKSSQGSYYYAYTSATGSWAQTSAASVAEETTPSGAPDPAQADGGASGEGDSTADVFAMRDDYSLVDTDAAVARALPMFEAAGTATSSNGEPMVVLRHRAFPEVRLAIQPIFLDDNERVDGVLAVFGGGRKKSDAFARMWAARHPGTIIDYLWLDPDATDGAPVFDVGYVGSVEHVADSSYEKWARFRYSEKTHAWKSLPVPDE